MADNNLSSKNEVDKKKLKKQILHFLKNRDIFTQEQYKNVRYPLKNKRYSYKEFLNGEKFVNMLYKQLKKKTPVFIIGDYDVDGILSATVIYQSLTHLNKDNKDNIHILNRRRSDNYGIQIKDIDTIKHSADKNNNDEVNIIILDNGISKYDVYDYINNKIDHLKINTFVIDHHEQLLKDKYKDYYKNKYNKEPKNKLIIVDPYQKDDEYPFKGLSATGIAYKMMLGITSKYYLEDRQSFLPINLINELMCYVGITVITDACEIFDENRYYVQSAIDYMKNNKTYDNNLMTFYNCLPFEPTINAELFGWTIGPILNANSRMNNNVGLALNIFNNDNNSKIKENTEILLELNNKRKKLVQTLVDDIIHKINVTDDDYCIILNLDDYTDYDLSKHNGIIGLLTGKVSQLFQRPTLLLSYNENIKALSGSARSTNKINFLKAVKQAHKILPDVKFGGHNEAFGVSKLKLDELSDFRKLVNYNLKKNAEDNKTLDKKLDVIPDYDFTIEEMSYPLIQSLNDFAPFGQGFGKAIYKIKTYRKNLNISFFGDNEQHLKIVYTDEHNKTHILKQWNSANEWKLNNYKDNDIISIFFSTDTFKGQLQLIANRVLKVKH